MKYKNKIQELDVGFIGEQNRPLTKEEQLEISAFIQKLKTNRKPADKVGSRKSRSVSKSYKK